MSSSHTHKRISISISRGINENSVPHKQKIDLEFTLTRNVYARCLPATSDRVVKSENAFRMDGNAKIISARENVYNQ